MKILITDDDPLILDSLAELLELEGFSPIKANNGQEAIHLWKNQKPDLVCLDIMMPVMDGYQVCKTIRKTDPHTPILFLSAKNQELDVIAGLDLGADDFIRKPFSAHEVLARIRSALRRAKPQHSHETLILKNLTIFPEQLRAERNNVSIDLTPREVNILSLLHEMANAPVSRDTLLDRCWGVNYFPDSRTLDQHISILRKKIQTKPHDPEIITTVRSIGYTFRT
ncbi:response regulator transcription factor [Rubritalea tangerina]|uniref:Response regulator transcription factor n=2 Tax=Rubritalea tangerina TaxID=430798 RepID=A0ABW4ZCG8_9BACT